MTTYELGDVVLVSFPFSDQTQSKPRPAVVINVSEYSQRRTDYILAAITSMPGPRDRFDTTLTSWEAAGLKRPSIVKAVVVTLDVSLITRKLGTMKGSDRATVLENIRSAIAKA